MGIIWTNYLVPSLTTDLSKYHFKSEDMLNEILKNAGKESYHCLYDLEPRETFKQYKGSHRPSFGYYWFDFDHEESKGEVARIETIEFIKWMDVEDVCVFFSGSKGFHVGVPQDYVGIPQDDKLADNFKKLLVRLKTKFKTIDTSVSERVRKFRSPGSRHPKTGKYKRRLYLEELDYDMEKINQMASTGHGDLNILDIQPTKKREKLTVFDLILQMDEMTSGDSSNKILNIPNGEDSFMPFQSFPKKKCIERLFKSHADEGSRHQIALVLVQDLKQTKVNKIDAMNKIMKWAKLVGYPQERLSELSLMVDKAYSGAENYYFSCKNEFKERFCSSKCDVYKNLPKEKRPYVVDKTSSKKSFMEQIYKRVGFYLVDPIDDEKFPLYEKMAEWTFEQKNMCFNDAESLIFDGKKWDWMTKTALYSFIREKNEGQLDPQHLDNFIKMIKAACFKDNFNFQETDGLINLNNGILNVKTGELMPHVHQYLFKYVSPVDYVKDAKSPKWEKFLEEVFSGKKELIDLVQKMFGYILIGGEPFLHKSFCLVGSGRNGKSTLLEILKAVTGKDSYSTVSMAKLDKEFSLVSIDGKLANIAEETPNDEINSEAFKTMVAGGEIRAAHKGFDEYSFKCKARFVFACNDMPIFRDKNASMLDRLIFIPFDRYFTEQERNPFIVNELKEELSGIINWSVEGAKIITREKIISTGDEVKSAKELYLMESDTVYAWFHEHIVFDKTAKGIPTSELYEKYKAWSDAEGHRPCNKNNFSKRAKNILAVWYRENGVTQNVDGRIYVDKIQVRGFSCIFYKI